VKKQAADEGDAGGEDDSGDRGKQALLPGGGGDEEGGVDEGVQGEDAEKEGKRAAEIEKQRSLRGEYSRVLEREEEGESCRGLSWIRSKEETPIGDWRSRGNPRPTCKIGPSFLRHVGHPVRKSTARNGCATGNAKRANPFLCQGKLKFGHYTGQEKRTLPPMA
jgi:hypothetical protein